MRVGIAGACISAALLTLPFSGQAEHPVTRLFTTDDGLVRNWVQRIRSDRRGYLWFCTVEGLSLFDGERFVNYGTAQGLPHQIVNDILEAGDGSYWLATYGGLYRFRPRAVRAASFERIPLNGGDGDPKPAALLRTRSGETWIGTSAGLYHILTSPRVEGVAVPLAPASKRFPEINALEEDNGGSLWAATEQGLVRVRSDGSSSFLSFMGRGAVPNYGVQTLLLDHRGFLWAGGWGGISRLDVQRDPPAILAVSPRMGARFGIVQSIYEARNGDLWVGARGLARLPAAATQFEKQVQFFDGDSVLAHHDIFALSEDLAGNIWAAVSNLGVLRILRSGFSNYTEADGLESAAVLSVFETHDDCLYAVTGVKHTLNRFEQGHFTSIQPYVPSSIHDFGWGEHSVALEDRLGQWWIATMNGLLRYPKVARPEDLAHTPPDAIYRMRDGLPSNAITRLFEDRDGGIWIGCADGIARWNPTTGGIENFTSAVQAVLGRTPVPFSFAQDKLGEVWIGFYNGGLVRYRDSRFQNIAEGLPAGSINGLLTDHTGRLWIASGQEGLGRIDAPAEDRPVLRKYAGLRSSQLFAVAEDRSGHIYVGGGQGVEWLDPDTGAIHHVASGSGLPQGEIQRMHSDRQGAIWFASHFGLARYVPGSGPAGPTPAPWIREVRVAGAPVVVSDEGELQIENLAFGAGKDSVEIGYGAVDFSVGNRVRYRYRLLPVESIWRQPDTTRSAHYAGIGPGSYRFEVQAVGLSGIAGAETASVGFRIDWPFWKTWWFRLVTGAFAVSLGLAAHLYRVRHLLAVERVRARLAADLHDDLGSGLAEIAILTEVARTQQHPNHLESVAQRARELRGAMSDIVWSVDPARDNLEDLIRRFRQTAAAMLGDDRLEFLVTSTGVADRVELTPEWRRNVLLMFKEIVTNVARHAHAARVTVKVVHTPGRLELEVHDDGRGFRPEEARSGNGLRSIARRAGALRARLEIDSAPGYGATVRVEAPLR